MILDLADLRRYRPLRLSEAGALRTAGGLPMVTATPYLLRCEVDVPAISFGITTLDDRPLRQTPHDVPAAGQYAAGPIDRYVIRDAVVHSRHGVVTSGDVIFTDFLDHIPLHLLPGVGPDGEGGWMFPAAKPHAVVGDAVHLLAANLDNYYHWLLDVMSRHDPLLCERVGLQSRPVLLVPQPHAPWQGQTLDLLATGAVPVMRLDHGAVVAVERLVAVPSL